METKKQIAYFNRKAKHVHKIGSCLIPSKPFYFSKDGTLTVRGLLSIKKDNLHDTINERFKIKCFAEFLDQCQYNNMYKL